jgi:hypothetical protein
MEVHAHSHTSRKKWTHYLWEFLMLFLAVFCGFLAEYQLEHQIEKERGRQFVQTYIEDLRTDTAALRPLIKKQSRKVEMLDSLMFLLRDRKIKGYENDLYFFCRNIFRFGNFKSNDRTFSQLKGSGSFRLIKNKEVVDSILNYQKRVEGLETVKAYEHEEIMAFYPMVSRMFSAYEFENMTNSKASIARPLNNPLLRSYDTAIIDDLAFYVHQIKGSTESILNVMIKLHAQAGETINFLKSQYHLK